jgi:pyruvate/2-oxoglutarate dehydrogenase complex dihydrolipoamide dehydrogenase (E3) component
MLVRDSVLLSAWEPFVGEAVAEELRSSGVDVRTGVTVRRVRREQPGAPVLAELSDGSSLLSEEFLVATGRTPSTADLGLETVGLTPGGWLEVDDSCRVTAVEPGWLYAVGDINRRALLTHMGKYQGRMCAAGIVARAQGRPTPSEPWADWEATADHSAVPQVLFTRPEAASVGLTLARAESAGLTVRAVDYPIGQVSGAALSADGYRGQARMVVDEERSLVVGCTLVGPGVGELIHAATVAIVGEVPLQRLWHAVPAFPTAGELWLRLLEQYGL